MHVPKPPRLPPMTTSKKPLPPRGWAILNPVIERAGFVQMILSRDLKNSLLETRYTEYLSLAEHEQLVAEARASAFEEAAKLQDDWGKRTPVSAQEQMRRLAQASRAGKEQA